MLTTLDIILSSNVLDPILRWNSHNNFVTLLFLLFCFSGV